MPGNRRGPLSAALSFALTAAAVMIGTIPGIPGWLGPSLGVLMAVCVWFAGWGLLGGIVGFAAVAWWLGLPPEFALVTALLNLLAGLALLRLIRYWRIDAAEGSTTVGLVNLAQPILIALLVRLVGWFALNLALHPAGIMAEIGRDTGFLILLTVASLAYALLLLRFATPLVQPLRPIPPPTPRRAF